MELAVLRTSQKLEIGEIVVQPVAVAVVDDMTLRNRAVCIHPHAAVNELIVESQVPTIP